MRSLHCDAGSTKVFDGVASVVCIMLRRCSFRHELKNRRFQDCRVTRRTRYQKQRETEAKLVVLMVKNEVVPFSITGPNSDKIIWLVVTVGVSLTSRVRSNKLLWRVSHGNYEVTKFWFPSETFCYGWLLNIRLPISKSVMDRISIGETPARVRYFVASTFALLIVLVHDSFHLSSGMRLV